jgi:hypothetical protein
MDQHKPGATLDWTAEDEYWRSNYRHRPYADQSHSYDYWQPAYRYGYDSARRYQNRKWEDVESDLRGGWDRYEHRGSSMSTWEQVKNAVRDAWDRMVGNR